jgi:UDP-glucose 4-epimerase
LVTGGAGFIGSHLVRRLLKEGIEVVVLDDLSSGGSVPSEASLIQGCVTDRDAVREAMVRVNTVFHLAAVVSVPECEQDPSRCDLVNIQGTARVVEQALSVGASLVFASSCAVYGEAAQPPCAETCAPDPCSAYARSKLAGEQLVLRHPASTCLRLFNVIGAGQRPDVAYAAVAPIFAEKLLAGQPLPVHGDGQQTRDLVPVDLVVEAMRVSSVPPTSRTLNVGTGRGTTLLSLIAMLEEVTGVVAELVHEPPRAADIPHSWADVNRLTDAFGLPGTHGDQDALTEAVRALVEALRTQ